MPDRTPCTKRLEDVLNLRNNRASFKSIKTNISKIAREHFNLSLIASDQKDALERVKAKLKEEYPDLFEEDSDEARKRLACALSYAFRCHSRARERSELQRRKKSVDDHNGKEDHDRHEEHFLQRSRQGGGPSATQRRLLSIQDTASTSQVPTSSSHQRLRSSGFAAQSSSSHSSIQAPAHPRERQEIRHTTGRIYDFLSFCTPPMTHFLKRFMDLECNTEELLFAISMWPQARIEDFLRKLPPGPDGRMASDWEIMVLK